MVAPVVLVVVIYPLVVVLVAMACLAIWILLLIPIVVILIQLFARAVEFVTPLLALAKLVVVRAAPELLVTLMLVGAGVRIIIVARPAWFVLNQMVVPARLILEVILVIFVMVI